jgi:amino acid adenylation domain-containing protein
VLRELAHAAGRASARRLPALAPAARPARLPLSFAQQRLWFIAQMGQDASAAYHVPGGLRLHGTLDVAALHAALQHIVRRHEALRTRFEVVDGQPVQRIAANAAFPLPRHTLTDEAELAHWQRVEAETPFDLATGPLIRARLLRLAPQDHVLLLTLHHIVSDGWSMGVLMHELGQLYQAHLLGQPDPLPALPVQYADYALWQRQWLGGELQQQQLDHWRHALADAPALSTWPTDRPRPAVQDYAGLSMPVTIDPDLTDALKALSQRHGTTLYMTLLAAWAALASRLAAQDHVVIGSPTANRRCAEVEPLIGFFVNTLALPFDFSHHPSVAQLLDQTKHRVLQAQAHQDLPFEQVVDALKPQRSLAHHPLFQTLFAWQNAPRQTPDMQGLRLAPLDHQALQGTQFDLALSLHEAGDQVAGVLGYASSLYQLASVQRRWGHFKALLRGLVQDDERPVHDIELLSPAQRRQMLVDWNAARVEVPPGCVHELIAQQARRAPQAPQAPAVEQDGQVLRYGELEARAERLAHALRGLGVAPDRCVAVCLPRGIDGVVALLAVLKAGGAYVPLDPRHPPGRLRHLLHDCAPVALLTTPALQPLLEAPAGTAVLSIEGTASMSAAAGAPAPMASPGDLAYVIYTSGSTGQPKGVMVTHANLANLVAWHRHAFALAPLDRSSCLAGLGFDACAWEIWPVLSAGATLVLAPDALSEHPAALLDWWHQQSLHSGFLVTALAEAALARGDWAGKPLLRTLLTGGDRLRQAPPAGLPDTIALVNNYGPTEATVVASSGRCRPQDGPPSIGRPIANARIYLLDRRGGPVPPGVTGEIHIGGAGVARGYLNQPTLTRERFLPDPFAPEPGARMYKTGDLARWRADGTLDFLGRNDHQVQLRGVRIELGEIETQLGRQPGVREAAVLAREDRPNHLRLVAYLTGDARPEALREALAQTLPAHMLPSAFVVLPVFPLTPNGKLDRQALPMPEAMDRAERPFEAPQGEAEQTLAAIWRDLLQVARVGRDDHFFDLGGHSLLIVDMVERLRQQGFEVEVRAIYQAPVLRAIAGNLRRARAPVSRHLVLLARGRAGHAPVFFIHEPTGEILSYERVSRHLPPELPVYALQAAGRDDVDRPLSVEALARRYLPVIRGVQPHGPYRLGGWSGGGILAYEIAHQLLGEGDAVDFLALIDSSHPDAAAPQEALTEEQRIWNFLKLYTHYLDPRLDEASVSVLDGQGNLEGALAHCRQAGWLPAGFTVEELTWRTALFWQLGLACLAYRPPRLPIPLHLFAADVPPGCDPSLGWEGFAGPSLRNVPIPGSNHFSIVEEPVVAMLGAAITQVLQAAGSTSPPTGAPDPHPSSKENA